jgi:ATP:cob(I)alamin adenosyltransferase
MKIYTRTGDEGETALFGGGRVGKTHPRVRAYGTVDELNSFLGRAVLSVRSPEIRERLGELQHDLFALGSNLATPPRPDGGAHPHVPPLPLARIHAMEEWMDAAEEELPPLRNFILPGEAPEPPTSTCAAPCAAARSGSWWNSGRWNPEAPGACPSPVAPLPPTRGWARGPLPESPLGPPLHPGPAGEPPCRRPRRGMAERRSRRRSPMIQRAWSHRLPDGARIRAGVLLPEGPPPDTAVVLVHGFKGFKDWGFFPHTAEALAADGHAAISLNFSLNGIGDRPTEFTELEAFGAIP